MKDIQHSVLVVDDEKGVRQLINMLLKNKRAWDGNPSVKGTQGFHYNVARETQWTNRAVVENQTEKHGSTIKKIAEIINRSPRTIDIHRKNIHRKIGLDKKSKNLRSFLISLHWKSK